jgi:hypothetical protein
VLKKIKAERILKTVTEKQLVTYKGSLKTLMANFYQKSWWLEGRGMTHL